MQVQTLVYGISLLDPRSSRRFKNHENGPPSLLSTMDLARANTEESSRDARSDILSRDDTDVPISRQRRRMGVS